MAKVTRTVPSTSKIADKTTNKEMTDLYNQISTLITTINKMQERIDALEGK